MSWPLILLTITITFFLMEGVAWFTHKYIMHGFLWTLHKDHHFKSKASFWERNDAFFLIFAIPAFLLMLYGSISNPLGPLFWIGVGISIYGLCYFLVHDIFIHQRLPLFKKSNHFYLKAIRKAHKIHHKHLAKENGECFGMLWVPLKYFKEALNPKR
ncbi:sterol desaturase family protein [Xanthovirga aplysinae]|uniref:sterol desaturase family protein n=1 Tax=Xanthovirga aplysinae TaxID=2529853 RepID=UPI0012BBB0F0|nr:sterol desaturase family protein [Xanthovirga aplysinae]MTI33494.1 beta-carotene hydroxylase [Xanthovirga aplysinae]